MVIVSTDRRMVEHRPPSWHPERPERLQTVLRQLERSGLLAACPSGVSREATRQELERVHSAAHVDAIFAFEGQRGRWIEADTWIAPGSKEAARLAAGIAVEAVNAVLAGPIPRALCLVRPPGHHARPDSPMGFCLFDNVAVAAAHAVHHHGLSRVLIVDFDVHHGNGTQDIFYADPNVAFLSTHRAPFYPGTGAKNETGTGAGLGLTKNIPLAFGIARNEFHAAFRSGLETLADKVRPELVLISAGFDAHEEDPVGSLGLLEEDFESITDAIVGVANTHASGRIVSVLEGGYNLSRLAGCVELHLKRLGAQPPETAAK